MYQGEVQIQQEYLDRFLEGANKFKLEGLMGSENSNDMKNEDVKQFEDEDLMKEQPPLKNIARNQNIAPKPRKESSVRVVQDNQLVRCGFGVIYLHDLVGPCSP